MNDPTILAALQTAFNDGSWGMYHGGHVVELEQLLAQQFRVDHALTCASGTLAVEVALRALKVSPGDEVILAAYDYEANFLTVHAIGAKPVLIDVAPNNWNLDPQRMEEAISPGTKAIIVSHLHGGLVPMSQVMEIARKHHLGVVEDAAQAAGAIIEGRPAGSWGDVGILSFGGSKLLHAGRGGAILTHRADLLQRAKLWLSRGVQQWAAISELQAIVLKPQLKTLEEQTRIRAQRVSLLPDLPGLKRFENLLSDSSPAYYKVGFRFDPHLFGISRSAFVTQMRSHDIPFDEGFRALHMSRSPSRFRAVGPLLEAERAHHGVVKLHHHPLLLCNEETVEKVAIAMRRAYRKAE